MELTGIVKVNGFMVVIGTARQANEAKETRINIYRELMECGVITPEVFRSFAKKVEILNLKPSPVKEEIK